MADQTVKAYHDDLTGEGSKDNPVEMPIQTYHAMQSRGWKRARARKDTQGTSEQQEA